MKARGGLALAVLACCGQAPTPANRALPEGIVCEVAGAPVSAGLVAQVGRLRGSPHAALDALVEDALAADGARSLGLDRSPGVAWASVAALARQVPLRLEEEARAEGPPTADELATVEVQHAVVLRTPNVTLATALARAEALAAAVSTAHDQAEFTKAASSMVRGARVVTEDLAPFDVTGRTARGDEFDAAFVTAAMALHAPGEVSGVVETPFGWHVLRLLARTPCPDSRLGEARVELGAAVLSTRVRLRLSRVLASRRRQTSIEVASAADALVSLPGAP